MLTLILGRLWDVSACFGFRTIPTPIVIVPLASALLLLPTPRGGAIVIHRIKVSVNQKQVLSWPQNSVLELGSHKMSTICPDLDILNQLLRYCWFRNGYEKNKWARLEMLPVILRFAPIWGPVCGIVRGSNFISQGLWKGQVKPTACLGIKLNAPSWETSNSSLLFC